MPVVASRRFGLPLWLWAGMVVAVLVAFVVGLGSAASTTTPALAPAWSGTTLNGATLTSADERGHWLVLNFFATWCGPCKTETPQLAQFSAANPPGTVQVVGVLFSDSVGDARSFAQSHEVTWPLLTDAGDRIASAYRVDALPQSFVIRPDGTVAAHLFGGVTAAGLARLVGGAA